MATLVFDIETSDPASFVGVSLLFLGVAVVATLAPALRAARISPVDAIRDL